MSSEYGWSDEYILDLPLVRLRQITAAIQRRVYQRQRVENARFSWLARQVSMFIAAGYMVEGENTAVAKAGTLAYDRIEAAALGNETEGNKKPESGNDKGSYETLMRLFAQKRG